MAILSDTHGYSCQALTIETSKPGKDWKGKFDQKLKNI